MRHAAAWALTLAVALGAPAPRARALQADAQPVHGATCFDGQLPADAWAAAAAQAAVRLVATLADGRGFASASAIVVAGSGHPNRMLTAAHVLRLLREQPGARLAVYSSRGVALGTARLAARAAPGPAFGLAGGGGGGDAAGLRFGDAAVIEMAGFAAGGAAAYAQIAGLPLAAAQPPGLLEGEIVTPAGVDHGISGAGVVADGAIVGVMAFKARDPTMKLIPVTVGDALAVARHRTIRLPRTATAYAQPVIDANLLAGLGPAGARVGHARADAPLAVLVPGFISNGCVAFRGSMHPA